MARNLVVHPAFYSKQSRLYMGGKKKKVFVHFGFRRLPGWSGMDTVLQGGGDTRPCCAQR